MLKNYNETELLIGNKKIGVASPPLIIAELSANHNGSLDRAIKLVEKLQNVVLEPLNSKRSSQRR